MANNEKLALRSWLFKIEKFWTHTLKPAGNRLQTREVALRMNRCFSSAWAPAPLWARLLPMHPAPLHVFFLWPASEDI